MTHSKTHTRVQRLRAAVAGAAMAVLLGSAGAAFADTSATIVDSTSPAQTGFKPGIIRIAPGNWVTWSNTGADAHTVTARDGSFDSGELAPSEGFSWYFDRPGTYEYVCTLHPWMQGRVIVGGGPAAQAPAPTPAARPTPGPAAPPTPEPNPMMAPGDGPADGSMLDSGPVGSNMEMLAPSE
ncbi:MAG: cupredoxin domain-containing protein [Chloroflexi bacterium]|nr:cupredoxin domain-containing protein [Chloroflexota bacterium]